MAKTKSADTSGGRDLRIDTQPCLASEDATSERLPEQDWELLLETSTEAIFRGAVLRCQARYPYESMVDFMLVNYPDAPSSFALIVTSGYKAGHILIILPPDSKAEKVVGISVNWLKENWQKWIYEIGPKEVYFSEAAYRISADWAPNNSKTLKKDTLK